VCGCLVLWSRHRLSEWLSMVGSSLNSTGASHVLPLATHCDLDGGLLVADNKGATGGFVWSMADGECSYSANTIPGLEIRLPFVSLHIFCVNVCVYRRAYGKCGADDRRRDWREYGLG
jgi:hypothetical protein